jgi:AcrR family transcriptional regulator
MSADERPSRLTASARRAQLIEVGRTVFAERGYEATYVEEIAERAKVSKPIVYEHFGGKEGLYAVVIDREMEHIVARITEAISSGSPRERLEFRKAGYDAKAAPIYAHALVGMVTFVGQWWTETRKPPVEQVASHIAALAWMGLRHLPMRPSLSSAKRE